jgi:hypothetical protein
MLSAADLQQALSEFPSYHSGPQVALEWVEGQEGQLVSEHAGYLRVTLRLISYDADGAITTIKEQDCVLVRAEHRDTSPERLRAYLQGWTQALAELFATPGFDGETLMPCELAAPAVLGLKTAHTADDFQARLLVKSRLGRLRSQKG